MFWFLVLHSPSSGKGKKIELSHLVNSWKIWKILLPTEIDEEKQKTYASLDPYIIKEEVLKEYVCGCGRHVSMERAYIKSLPTL